MKRYHESLQLVQTLRGIPLKIFILFLLFGGLGALRVEASGQDSLSVESVNKIGAFNESRLAHDIGLVRFEPSGHPKLAQQVDALRVVVDIRNHRNFKAFGLTDELLGRIASTINTDGYAQIVSNLRVFIDKFSPNKIKGLELLVNNLGHTESSFREGAEWTLRYLANNADEFTGASKVSFEVLEKLPDGRKRIADMVVEYPQGGRVYYEFKSVKNLPPKDFIQQFSGDLTRPNFSIDNLRWVFDRKKIQAKDLQKLRNKLESIITNKMAESYGYVDADDMIDVLFDKVFVVK